MLHTEAQPASGRCFLVTYDMSMVWSVCVYRSCYVSDGFNLWCVSDAVLWVSCLCFIFSAEFSCYTRGPVLFSRAFLHLWVFQWYPVTENNLIEGVQQISCFLPEDGCRAGFRNRVFSYIYIYTRIYLLHNGQSPREEDCISKPIELSCSPVTWWVKMDFADFTIKGILPL